MTLPNQVDAAKQDLLQETATQYASKLLDKGAEALRGLSSDVRALAGDASDRALHFQSMLANLGTLSTAAYRQLSDVELNKLSAQTRAYVAKSPRASGTVSSEHTRCSIASAQRPRYRRVKVDCNS